MRYLFLCSIMLVLSSAQALELYWDDNSHRYETTLRYSPAVLFHDYDGPGDTDGLPGIIYEFNFGFSTFGMTHPSCLEVYIYEVGDSGPGDSLGLVFGRVMGPPEHGWYTFRPYEPLEVPGEFFVVIEGDYIEIWSDDTPDSWGCRHSWYLWPPDETWYDWEYDFLIRIDWEPQEVPVHEATWGQIKASYN